MERVGIQLDSYKRPIVLGNRRTNRETGPGLERDDLAFSCKVCSEKKLSATALPRKVIKSVVSVRVIPL